MKNPEIQDNEALMDEDRYQEKLREEWYRDFWKLLEKEETDYKYKED